MDTSTILLTLCVVIFTAAAALIDWRTHRLPNWLTVSSFIAALLFHFTWGFLEGGILTAFSQLGWALAGFLTGFGILFVLWLTGGGLGGDVKLMGAVGAWLMPRSTLFVFILSCAIVTLVLGIAFLWALATGRLAEMRKAGSDARRGKDRKKEGLGAKNWYQVVPYGVSLTLATWAVLAFYLIIGKGFPFLQTIH